MRASLAPAVPAVDGQSAAGAALPDRLDRLGEVWGRLEAEFLRLAHREYGNAARDRAAGREFSAELSKRSADLYHARSDEIHACRRALRAVVGGTDPAAAVHFGQSGWVF